MNVFDAIKSRHCKRKFLDKQVNKETLEKILLIAGNAASSKNSQPWQATIVSGSAKNKLKTLLCEKAELEKEDSPEYTYMTHPMPDLYLQRAKKVGYELFALKGIDRKDTVQRKEHWMENYRFFNAPVVMIFHLHKGAERGNFLDMGLFLQNIMLGLVSEGLGSCPQFSLCSYAETIKEFLHIPLDKIVVCGLSLGYVDESDKVNSFIPERLPLSSYTQWVCDE